ncbi:MAG: hypothetical protein ACXWRE_09780 [Pseudobdellovibrionaceae bacterium]
MKLTVSLLAVVLASAGIAKAANSQPSPLFDLSNSQASPQEILDGLRPFDNNQKIPKDMPQSCKDAAITPEQKTKIEEAVYQASKDKVQLDADIKLAFMNYSHTVKDPTSDLAAAQTASTQLSDSINKLVVAHINIGNHILYDIVTPEQRANTFECIKELHKKCRKKQ